MLFSRIAEFIRPSESRRINARAGDKTALHIVRRRGFVRSRRDPEPGPRGRASSDRCGCGSMAAGFTDFFLRVALSLSLSFPPTPPHNSYLLQVLINTTPCIILPPRAADYDTRVLLDRGFRGTRKSSWGMRKLKETNDRNN